MSQNARVIVAVMMSSLMGAPLAAGNPPPPPQAVRDLRSARDEEPLVIEFDELTLSASGIVHVSSIPESLRRLEGRRVQIRGFMAPPMAEHGNPGFIAIPEVLREPRVIPGSKHFEARAEPERIRYSIPVLLPDGETIDWTPRRDTTPLLIEGTLRIEGDEMNLEWGHPFWIENASWKEVEPRRGYTRLWPLFVC